MARKTGSELSRELGKMIRKGIEKGFNGSNPLSEAISKMVRDVGGKINYVKPTEETK